MPKRRNTKASVDDETDRSCRESSSDGSVLENSINNGTANSKARKCKTQGLNKTTKLSKRTPKSKRLSESSCDSVVKEVSENNLVKIDEVTSPDKKDVPMPEQSSGDVIENSEEPVSDDKENQIEINNNKFSELMTLLGGKDGDIESFIQQYKIWQQSQPKNGKQFNTKIIAKSSKLKQPLKSRGKAVTPVIKLCRKASSKKNKDSNISSVADLDDVKKTFSQCEKTFSQNKTNDIDSSNSMVYETANTEIKNGVPVEHKGHSNDAKDADRTPKEDTESVAVCGKDVQNDNKPDDFSPKIVSKDTRDIDNSCVKSNQGKAEELSKEEASKCSNPVDAQVNTDSKDISCKNAINTKFDQKIGSNEIKGQDKEDLYIAPEIKNIIVNKVGKSLSEGENLKNKEINTVLVDYVKKDLVNEVEKCIDVCNKGNKLDYPHVINLFAEVNEGTNDRSNCSSYGSAEDAKGNDEVTKDSNDLQNIDLGISYSNSGLALNDESDNHKTNQSVIDNIADAMHNSTLSKFKSQSCLSLTNFGSYAFDAHGAKPSEDKSKEKAQDNSVVSDILDINYSILDGQNAETETVWKRKRRMSDESSEFSKKTKYYDNLQNEAKSDGPHDNLISSEQCSRWSNDESNSFFEELIYSDEEKINNLSFNEITHNSIKSCEENLCHKLKSTFSKSELDSVVTEKSNIINSNHSRTHDNFNTNLENCKESTNFGSMTTLWKEWGENNYTEDSNKEEKNNKNKKGSFCGSSENTIHRKVDKDLKAKSTNKDKKEDRRSKHSHKERKEEKHSKTKACDSSGRSKHHDKERDKVIKISSNSEKHAKNKSKSKKSFLSCKDDVEDLKMKDKYDHSYQSMLKRVKKHLKNGRKSILETDLPVVEVSYKGESLHGILGSVDNVDFLTRYKLYKEARTDEEIMNSSYAQGILIKSLRPLCSKMVRRGSCKNSQNCRKEHTVPEDFFINMDKHDAWMIIACILNISCCLSGNILIAILEFLSKYKAKKKILYVCSHIFQSQQNNFPIVKSFWESVLGALDCCGLERWEGIRFVLQFIIDTKSFLNPEVFHQLLKIWNVHRSSLSNTWQIVEPLVTGKIIVLHPTILMKILGEIIAVEPRDKINVYRLIVEQLTSLGKDDFNQIGYRLLNDFLRKVSQEGLHSEEKLLRDIMNTSYYSPFLHQQAPSHNNSSSLRRSRSLTNLTCISSESKYHGSPTVHEEEKMMAAMLRALQCSNYDSVIKVLLFSNKKIFIKNILLVVFKYASEIDPYGVMKNIFIKLKTNFAKYADEIKDMIGNIVVTLMLDFVKEYNWKEANNYLILLDENHLNKYKLKSLTDGTLRPVRLAVVYSEIHYYNGRFKESIGVFIDTRLIDPDSTQWAVPGGNEEDFEIINVMLVFLMSELIKKNVINIATMLFKALLEAQTSISKPNDLRVFFEKLLYKLFELTNEYPETAVKLYMRVMAKDSSVSLCGLTYRALIVLAFRTHKRAIIKDIFYKAINEYVYPIIEENENVIMLLRSYTEEEIIVYILEWVARFKEKKSDPASHQIKIKFKDALLEDYLDNKELGIPAILKEVDQTLPGAFKRLESVLKRLNIKIKQIKKDTFSIDPSSFENFLNKIKIR